MYIRDLYITPSIREDFDIDITIEKSKARGEDCPPSPWTIHLEWTVNSASCDVEFFIGDWKIAWVSPEDDDNDISMAIGIHNSYIDTLKVIGREIKDRMNWLSPLTGGDKIDDIIIDHSNNYIPTMIANEAIKRLHEYGVLK